MNNLVKDIYVWVELRHNKIQDVSLQLLSEANYLKAQYKAKNIDFDVVGVVTGYQVDSLLEECFKYGADRLIVCDDIKLKEVSTQHTTKAISDIINHYHPDSLLIGASVIGRDIAPRIAARLNTGLTADATLIEVDEAPESTLLLVTRPAFGGNLFGTIVCPNTRPQMATIRPNVFEKRELNHPIQNIETFTTSFDSTDWVKVMLQEKKLDHSVDISKARIIVSAGRSMAKHMDLIEQIAKELGAEVGASRGLVETGSITKDHQVGQTGKTVRPLVYIACGISGAVQHTAGMDKAECIIAINNDPNASIFQIAHIGIVGDAVEILPKLKAELLKLKA